MSLSLTQHITRNILNIPGWRTKRKIIVIESDDWGSIRMASGKAFQQLKAKGYPVEECAYNKYDALESGLDLSMLFDVLASVKDKNGNPAKLTANWIMANPDFDKITGSGYQQYYYEPFTETYKRYSQHENSFQILKDGINAGVVKPQFHGKEHLNVRRWMRSLQANNSATKDAFSQQMFSVHQPFDASNKNEFMDALDYDCADDIGFIESIVTEGLNLFNQVFGYKSKSFIASCYIWHSSLEKKIANSGVKYIQGMVIQNEPIAEPGTLNYNKRYHYQGQKNKYEQRYLLRNAFFEPSQDHDFDWIIDCLNRISIAFSWNKPAIISSHRVNFIGFIDPQNRDQNLRIFASLLKEIIKRWPDVEFLSSDQLGDLISSEKDSK